MVFQKRLLEGGFCPANYFSRRSKISLPGLNLVFHFFFKIKMSSWKPWVCQLHRNLPLAERAGTSHRLFSWSTAVLSKRVCELTTLHNFFFIPTLLPKKRGPMEAPFQHGFCLWSPFPPSSFSTDSSSLWTLCIPAPCWSAAVLAHPFKMDSVNLSPCSPSPSSVV